MAGDVLEFWDMMHALMLPSGNDAAMALAEHFGKIVYEERRKTKFINQLVSDICSSKPKENIDQCRYFLNEMNSTAARLNMWDTNFSNPHGLPDKSNFSTASDLTKIAHSLMKVPDIRNVVNKTSFSCFGSNTSAKFLKNEGLEFEDVEELENNRSFKWTNTNKLLWLKSGFDGCKTGITSTAGPCMCASVRKGDQHLLIITLCAKSMDHRWIEIPRLATWAFAKLDKIKTLENKNSLPDSVDGRYKNMSHSSTSDSLKC